MMIFFTLISYAFFDRLWDDFGRGWGAFGAIFGGPGRVLEESSGSLFGRVVPKGSQRAT